MRLAPITAVVASIFTGIVAKSLLYKLECKALFQPKTLPEDYDYNLDELVDRININNSHDPHKLPVTAKEYNVDGISVVYFQNPNVKAHTIFAHGNGGNISKRIERMVNEWGDATSLVLFDYRGYGKSRGKSSEKTLYHDLLTVYKFMVLDFRVIPTTITLYGRSLGSAVVVRLAAELCDQVQLRPHGVVMESGFSSFNRLVSELTHPYVAKLVKAKLDSEKAVKKIDGRVPLLVSHSADDELIKKHHQAILGEAGSNVHVHVLSGGHNSPVYDRSYKSVFYRYLYGHT